MKFHKTHCYLIILVLLISGINLISCSESKHLDIYMSYPTPLQPLEEMVYQPFATQFNVWAPTAEEVRVLLYKEGESGHAEKMHSMKLNKETGIWDCSINKDLLGYFYTFNVKINGLWQGDTPGIMAKAVGINGKRAAIIDWNKTNPDGWQNDTLPSFKAKTDAIIYELHPRSFTIASCSGINPKNKGKLLGLVEDSTYIQSELHTTGLAHLKDIGITHVKLMPIFDFNSKDEKYPDENYSLGYDPLNFNCIEGLYTTNPSDPYQRITEFKEMVLKFHKAGIRVIMDVSYAYANPAISNFEKTTPGYFFRQDAENDFILASNGKAQIASHRPFVVQYMIESMLYWISEYHIDGFSLDLLNLYEPAALQKIQDAIQQVKPSTLLIGYNQKEETRLTEEKRSSISEVMNSYSQCIRANDLDSLASSYLLANPHWVEPFKAGLLGGVKHQGLQTDSLPTPWTNFTKEPYEAVNYISSHDGLTFADYLSLHTSTTYFNNERTRLSKLAYTALFTSQGIPMLYAGEEFLRSKKKLYNTEKCGDDINKVDWGLKVVNWEHYQYIKGLIQLRKKHPAFRINNKELIKNHIEFLPTDNPLVIAYQLKENANGDEWENIIVLFNSSREAIRVNIPDGKYIVVCKDGYINENGLSYAYGQAYVSGQSAMILYRTDKQVYIPQSTPTIEEDIEKEEPILKQPKLEFNISPIKKENNSSIIDKIEHVKID